MLKPFFFLVNFFGVVNFGSAYTCNDGKGDITTNARKIEKVFKLNVAIFLPQPLFSKQRKSGAVAVRKHQSILVTCDLCSYASKMIKHDKNFGIEWFKVGL